MYGDIKRCYELASSGGSEGREGNLEDGRKNIAAFADPTLRSVG